MRNRLHKRLVSFIIMVCMAISMSLTAFAATTTSLEGKISSAVSAGVSKDKISEILDGYHTGGDPKNELTITFEGKKYTFGGNSSILDEIETKIVDLQGDVEDEAAASAGTTQEVKKNISTQLGGLFKPADLTGAATTLASFVGPLTLFTGILATVAILGLSLFTACDVIYLSFPIAHAKMDSAGAGGGMMGGSTKDGGTKFRLVTDDAVQVYEETSKDGRSPWMPYLKRRGLTFILMAIIIYILLTGKITLIIDISLNLVQGIIDSLSKLAADTMG